MERKLLLQYSIFLTLTCRAVWCWWCDFKHSWSETNPAWTMSSLSLQWSRQGYVTMHGLVRSLFPCLLLWVGSESISDAKWGMMMRCLSGDLKLRAGKMDGYLGTKSTVAKTPPYELWIWSILYSTESTFGNALCGVENYITVVWCCYWSRSYTFFYSICGKTSTVL